MYKQRFVEEYQELSGRIGRLGNMLTKYANGRLEFEPDYPIELLREQLKIMTEYQNVLIRRSIIENIELE